jgi:hypothetical protein
MECHRDVVVEGRHVRHEAVHRQGGEVHERIKSIVPRCDTEERIEGLAVVGEVDSGEAGAGNTGHIEADHVVAELAQPRDRGPSELACAAGDADVHGPVPSLIQCRAVPSRARASRGRRHRARKLETSQSYSPDRLDSTRLNDETFRSHYRSVQ